MQLDLDVHCFQVLSDGVVVGHYSNAKCAAGTAIELMEWARRARVSKVDVKVKTPDGRLHVGRDVNCLR